MRHGGDFPREFGAFEWNSHDAVLAESADAVFGYDACPLASHYLIEDEMVIVPIERHLQIEIVFLGQPDERGIEGKILR